MLVILNGLTVLPTDSAWAHYSCRAAEDSVHERREGHAGESYPKEPGKGYACWNQGPQT